ncbi:tyrosine-type recombinase/integrase [Arsenicicoccus bolidensis]|uniref:Site-specific integrase n=1 Tax=Arsenicicoccus bolidensis TaxID=229480 RepID=A0ABS9PYV0_9MICO|nr:tyrosine-type recombinase/integrase [Arsenicicoccus bolidensis]MCG7320806.1 site-specific integrase [Arsenicicoccus bolidensis]
MSRRVNGEGSIYKTADGYRAYVWVTTPQGRRVRRYVRGKTREEVREKQAGLELKARRGPVAPSSPSVEAYVRKWLDEVVRPNLVRHTYAAYEGAARLYVIPGLGRKRIDVLSVSDVRQWINRLRVQCQCCAQGKDAARQVPRCCAVGQCCAQLPSDSTVHQAWRTLRAALSSAQRDELVPRNVAALVRMPVPRTGKASVWTVEEARRFLDSAREDDDPLYAGFVLLLLLGLRRGELLGLAWEDVDLASGEVRIAWQLQRIGGQFARTRVKTRTSDAVLPLPLTCVDALREQAVRQAQFAAKVGPGWQSSGLVVTSSIGTPMDPRNFHRKFKERAEKAGVPVIPVHSTRRTCATLLVHNGVHPRVAMQIVRHSQIAVTMDIYAQVASSSTRDALDQLDASFRGCDR